MATRDEELISELDDALKVTEGSLIQVRHIQKALEGARDTLRFVRNVLTSRQSEIPDEAIRDVKRRQWQGARS